MREGYIKSFDNAKIYRYAWDEVKKPKGVVLILHDMSEHAKRYEDFASFLNNNGYIVYANDLRAHGKSALGIDNLGKYDGANVVWDTIMDAVYFTRRLKDKYKLPVYVIGQGYGSFIALAYMQKCKLYSKVVLSGSSFLKNSLYIKLGKHIADFTLKNKGKDAPAYFLDKKSFGKFDKKVKNGSWLNSDNNVVSSYYEDPLCGFIASAKFYFDFLHIFDWLYSPAFMENIDKDKPVYLIGGKEDLFSKNGKLVQKLFKFLAHNDIHSLQMNLYENARHEVLNEKNKTKIYKDILKFLDKDNL